MKRLIFAGMSVLTLGMFAFPAAALSTPNNEVSQASSGNKLNERFEEEFYDGLGNKLNDRFEEEFYDGLGNKLNDRFEEEFYDGLGNKGYVEDQEDLRDAFGGG